MIPDSRTNITFDPGRPDSRGAAIRRPKQRRRWKFMLLVLLFVPTELLSESARAMWALVSEQPPRWAQLLGNLALWLALGALGPFQVGDARDGGGEVAGGGRRVPHVEARHHWEGTASELHQHSEDQLVQFL